MDLLASKHADTPISILSFPTQAELSHARVKKKQVALDTLNGSTADERNASKELKRINKNQRKSKAHKAGVPTMGAKGGNDAKERSKHNREITRT